MSDGLTLLTTTGARPEAFALCERWMAAQTFRGPVRWVIVDDGAEPQIVSLSRDGWFVEVHRRRPYWSPGENTQGANLRHALEQIDASERVVIIEDDDWYAPGWLEVVDAQLRLFELVGEISAHYYHVVSRRYRDMGNVKHASLCSTAMRGAALALFRAIVSRQETFYDILLYQKFTAHRLFDGRSVIGMKGLPGRAGIGSGHDRGFVGDVDASGEILRMWVGDKAAEAYAALRDKR